MRYLMAVLIILSLIVVGCGKDSSERDIIQPGDDGGAGDIDAESEPNENKAQDDPVGGNSDLEETPEQIESRGSTLTIAEAFAAAEDSECTEEGNLEEEYMINENTNTLWIELDAEKQGCNPACVVNFETSEVEINWRCTGAMP